MSNFWNRLDEIMNQLPDEEEDIGDIGKPRVLYKDGGGSGTKAAPAPTNPPHVNGFFDANYDRISKLAKEMNVPPNLMLGLTAGESDWWRPTAKNNLFGMTSTATKKLAEYPSPEAAIDSFRNSQWFKRLQNKSTPEEFVNELVDTTGGKLKYNSERDKYDEWVKSLISTVDRRLPIWQQNQSPSP